MLYGVKCPKCGLMQLPQEHCKSCGTILETQTQSAIPKRARVTTPKISPTPIEPSPDQEKPSQAEEGGDQSHPLAFYGTGGDLFGIQMVNMLLTIVTLGVYYFWGKVKVRRYILSETEFERDCFAYHGTGKELLLGFLKASVLFFIPLILLDIVPDIIGSTVVKIIAVILTYLLVILFIPYAMVGARRYRLSRTSWRGIRFSFRGKTWEFMKLFMWGSFLTTITLGLYYPIFETRRYGFLISHSYFGNQKFNFKGTGRELFRPYLLALLLVLPTLGLYWFWFLARKQRYFWEHTFFDTLRFRSTVTGRSLLNLVIGNFILMIITLGVAFPWILVRTVRFACDYVVPEGPLALEKIRQEAQAASATGEALGGFMDAGLDFG
jgi:uncharacterized membrane protein YjgN (DUF898 family)